MKTYIINLPSEVERKKNILEILNDQSKLDLEFIEAFDAREKNTTELSEVFDIESCNARRTTKVTKPEIGCTVSHYRCYERLLDSSNTSCLILEDDIEAPSPNFYSMIDELEKKVNIIEPTIILLSDWYWYSRKLGKLNSHYDYVKVENGYLTHSYLINSAAAKLLLRYKPAHVADEWRYIRNKGIRILAIRPHLIQQNWDGQISTSIQNQVKTTSNKSLYKRLIKLPIRLYMYYLKKTGRFYGPHKTI